MPLAEYLTAALQLGSLINTDGYAPWGFLGVAVHQVAGLVLAGVGVWLVTAPGWNR